MFKKICLIFCILFLFASICAAGGFQPAKTSFVQIADGVITAKSGYITGVYIISDGTNDATLILYDNASAASGNKIITMCARAAMPFAGNTWTFPVIFFNGIYADVTGTNASYVVEFISD